MTLLPLPEAAARLGLSTSALRRRLRAGTTSGERRPSPSGFTWWVAVPAEDGDGAQAAAHPDHRDAHPDRGDVQPDAQPSRAHAHPDGQAAAPQDAPGLSLATQRAAEMAEYSHRLLAPYVEQIAALSERCGRLEQDNDHLRARIAELETPSAPPESAGRSWWARLWGTG